MTDREQVAHMAWELLRGYASCPMNIVALVAKVK